MSRIFTLLLIVMLNFNNLAFALRQPGLEESGAKQEMVSKLTRNSTPAGAGLEEKGSRRWVKTAALIIGSVVIGSTQPIKSLADAPVLLAPEPPKTDQKPAVNSAPQTPKQALAALAQTLGPDRMVIPVVWGDPADLLKLPGFFDQLAQASMKGIFISSKFAELPVETQQKIIDQAKAAKIQRIGFLLGNPDWVLESKQDDVRKRITELTESLLKLDWGDQLRVVYVFDIEPHPKAWREKTGWNGDLSGYSRTLKEVILPAISESSRKLSGRFARPLVSDPPVITFEPHWWVNGNETEDGFKIRNLSHPAGIVIAGMTYQPTAERVLSVGARVWSRALAVEGAKFMVGVETKPDVMHTFYGREAEIPSELLKVYGGMPADAQNRFFGPFIHFGSAGEAPGTHRAYEVIGKWVKPSGLEEKRIPVLPAEISSETALFIQRTVLPSTVLEALTQAGIPFKEFDLGAIPDSDPQMETTYLMDVPAGTEREWVTNPEAAIINFRLEQSGDRPHSILELGGLIAIARDAADRVLQVRTIYRSDLDNSMKAIDTQL